MAKYIPTEQEVADFVRERHDRRMPGNSRLRAERAVALFRAATKGLKAKRKKKPTRPQRGAKDDRTR